MATKIQDTDTLSLAESAVAADKCVETIYRLVRSQRIPAKKDADGNWRIERRALLDYYTERSERSRLNAGEQREAVAT